MYIRVKQLTMKMFITLLLFVGVLTYLSVMFIFLNLYYLIAWIGNKLSMN